jgi:hypothetical protein
MFITLATEYKSKTKYRVFNFRPFSCVLCGHLSEGLDKYVLHLVEIL